MTNEEITKEIQKLKEENSSLKSLLEALNTKVAQMQIQLNTINAKVDINASYTLLLSTYENLIYGNHNEKEEE